MFEWMADPAAWASLATRTLMEIILGIDNIVFITMPCGDLPKGRHYLTGISDSGPNDISIGRMRKQMYPEAAWYHDE